MKTSIKFTLISLFALLYGCATTSSVISYFDDNVDFDAYQTYVLCIDDFQVKNLNFPEYDNDLIRQYIGDQIDKQMEQRAYKTNVMRPELQAGFQLIVEEKEVTFMNCEIDAEYNYSENYKEEIIPYTEETLVLYISDIAKNQIIWQASIVCDFNISEKKLLEYVELLADKMFNTYPIAKSTIVF